MKKSGKLAAPRALDHLENALKRRLKETSKKKYRYYVPTLWTSPAASPKAKKVNPFAYYLDAVKKVKKGRPSRRGKPTGGEWTKDAVIYNMFVRTTTAFDHNQNGQLDLPVSSEGFRETGTFLKAIALLPYIKQLGANTVHLLPITAIGHDGNKGTLGSPYAIRNPYELDENLSEPALNLDVRTECQAFFEAAHNLGFRVVVEFVFRTAAKDSDWVKEHPEWMYWIKDSIQPRHPQEMNESKYGSPIFTHEELGRIHHDVNARQLGNLLPPHPQYRDFFTQPPAPEKIAKEEGRYIGMLDDGTRVRIPGAFADWPPDDNQPPWGDVTYLRLYTHPDFNYIAYNTIRMYDTRLTQQQFVNRPLWDRIVGIIPYYQRQFNIDGVMIDMGHALPMDLKAEMVRKARSLDDDFAFWDENFSITQRSREEGYNAVFGFCWVDQHYPDRMRRLCEGLASHGFPIPFFATPENHNTPRASARRGGRAYATWAMVINAFLPAIPFIHSGYEIGELFPINTGLDFTNEDLKKYPSETLPLFSDYAYNWLHRDQFVPWVTKVLRIRAKYASLIVDSTPASFRMLHDPNGRVLAFARTSEKPARRVAIVGNTNFETNEMSGTMIDTKKKSVLDLLSGKRHPVKDGKVSIPLHPGQCAVFEY
jgi:starch synthase (maltosyl-transferring)